MSEDVTDKLTRFSPTAIDRDAVLFAAGKAAARRGNGWTWLAAGLLLSNAVTLAVLFWPKPLPVTTPPAESPPYTEPAEPARPDPYSYLALRNGFTPPPTADAGPSRAAVPLTPRSINDPRFQ